MPVPNDPPQYHDSGLYYPETGGQTARYTPEYVPDSEEERTKVDMLAIKGAAGRGGSGQPSSSGDRYGGSGENDRHKASGTGHNGGRRRSSSADDTRNTSGQPDRAHTHTHSRAHGSSGGPPSTTSSSSRPRDRDERPRNQQGPPPTIPITVSEEGPQGLGYSNYSANSSKTETQRREERQQYVGDKRPHEGPHGQRGPDSGRGERGPSRRGSGADAGGGGGSGNGNGGGNGGGSGGGGSGRYETEPLNTRRPQDDSRRIRDLDCEEQYLGSGTGAGGPQEGAHRPGGGMGDGFGGGMGGGGSTGSGRHQGHGSSTTRSYATAAGSPPDPTDTRPREGRPPPQGSAPPRPGAPPQVQMQQVQPGPGQGQGPPPPGQEISQGHPGSPPQGRPEGPPHNQGGHSRSHGGRPDGRSGQSSSASAQAARMKANEGQQYHEEHQSGGSGKGGLLGKVASYLTGGPAPAPPECQGHEEMLLEKQSRLEYQHHEITRLQYALQHEAEKVKQLQRQNAGLHEQLRIAQTELTNVHKELVDAKALSDTRGKELLGAQTFLTKADSVSVSELVGMARTVNDEIMQTAASLGEQLVPENYMITEDDPQQWRTLSESNIGTLLTQLMQEIPDKSTVNTLFAQIVIQALLCNHLAKGIQRWANLDPKSDTEELLRAVYHEIRHTENQAVSGRWRAITRARLRIDPDYWAEHFTVELQLIMRFAGWRFTNPELEDNLEEKFQAIFKAAERLCIGMGELFTSADIEVAMPEILSPFNPREQEDEWGDQRRPSSSVQDIVGGITGIGLLRRVGHDSDGKSIYETILPPKVVLFSSLRDIAEPPPPRPKRKKAPATADASG